MSSLRDVPILVVDCQTTGSSPDHGEVLELGWARCQPEKEVKTVEKQATHRLCAQTDGTVPGRITSLTGINEEDLEEAMPPEQAWAEFLATLDSDMPIVAHYAQFELSFLQSLAQKYGGPDDLQSRTICTHQIAKRLLGGLPRKGIRPLAGYLGYSIPENKRTKHHVPATWVIWKHVRETLWKRQSIDTLQDLKLWIERTDPDQNDDYQYLIDREKRLSLPDEPGVYRMLDRSDRVLYVGKAASLRSRVNSYFQSKRSLSEDKLELVTQVDDVNVQPAPSRLEASLREVEEIKDHNPPYNSKLKTGGRSVQYVSIEGAGWSNGSGSGSRLGPFDRRRPIDRLLTVLSWATEETVYAEGISDQRLQDVAESSNADEGLHSFLEDWCPSASDPTFERFLIVGKRLWKRDELTDDDPDKEDGEQKTSSDDQDTEYSVEEVHRRMEHFVKWGTRSVRRSRWIRRIATSEIYWKTNRSSSSSWRQLTFRHGKLKSISEVDEIPSSMEEQFEATEQRLKSIDAFDRLKVLTTELKRLAAENLPVRVQTAHERYNGRQLEDLLDQF